MDHGQSGELHVVIRVNGQPIGSAQTSEPFGVASTTIKIPSLRNTAKEAGSDPSGDSIGRSTSLILRAALGVPDELPCSRQRP